jgi:hypothetical protein
LIETKKKKKLLLQHHLSLIYILSKTKKISTSEKQKEKKNEKLCMRTQHVYIKRRKRPKIQKLNQQKGSQNHNRCEAGGGALVSSRFRLFSGNLGRGKTDAVGVTEEQDTLALALGAVGGLNPLASAGRGPHGLEEASPAGVGLGAVVVAHDGLDGLAGLVGVVEGDVADIVVQDVGLDDAVEDVTADEAEVTVDGGSGAAGKAPHLGLVVGEGGVGVLQEGNGDCKEEDISEIDTFGNLT